MIVEAVSISLLIICSDQLQVYSNISKQAKSLVFYVHQNFLTIVDLILSRLPMESNSSNWVLTLKNSVVTKRMKSVKRSEHSTALKQNCDIISNIIRTIIHMIQPACSSSLSILMHILANLDKYSVSTARSLLLPMKTQLDTILPPFLPSQAIKELTLVLDLDETLVHYSGQPRQPELLIRPYCSEFLESMHKFFELVIFTAGIQEVFLI